MKTLIALAMAALLAGCSSGGFYNDAETFNRVAGMYCGDKDVRTFMKHQDTAMIVCEDGSRFTVRGDL